MLCCSVLVTGLPSSASWQDLKVSFVCFLVRSSSFSKFSMCYSDAFFIYPVIRTICVEVVMSASPKCTMIVEVSSFLVLSLNK